MLILAFLCICEKPACALLTLCLALCDVFETPNTLLNVSYCDFSCHVETRSHETVHSLMTIDKKMTLFEETKYQKAKKTILKFDVWEINWLEWYKFIFTWNYFCWNCKGFSNIFAFVWREKYSWNLNKVYYTS